MPQSTVDTHAKNVSEDASSPDDAYDNLNCHDATSCFTDWANDDYHLDSGGSEITTLDDGDDLSGTFTDDIDGDTRSTWYIGADEIVAVGRTTYNTDAIEHGVNYGTSFRTRR